MPIRIISATVRNYRALASDSTPVSLNPTTVIIGTNSSGKSSFCDALAFLADAVTNGIHFAIAEGSENTRSGFTNLCKFGESRFSIRIDVENDNTFHGYYEIELKRTKSDYCITKESAKWGSDYQFEIRDGKWNKKWISDDITQIPSNDLLLPQLYDTPFAKLISIIANIRVYHLFPNILRHPDTTIKKRIMDNLGYNWPTIVDAILKGPRAGSWIVALNRLTDDIIDARIETSRNNKQTVDFLHGTETGKNRWIPANQESDSTLRAAALLAALIQDPPPSLIAIETPEQGIYAPNMELLHDFIHSAQRNSQIILTTHSPELLNLFDPEQVRVATRTNGTSRITTMGEDQFYAAKEGLRTLGDILRHEPLRIE
jgi:predicted ATPase